MTWNWSHCQGNATTWQQASPHRCAEIKIPSLRRDTAEHLQEEVQVVPSPGFQHAHGKECYWPPWQLSQDQQSVGRSFIAGLHSVNCCAVYTLCCRHGFQDYREMMLRSGTFPKRHRAEELLFGCLRSCFQQRVQVGRYL